MNEVFTRYIIGLLVGVILGILFPIIASTWVAILNFVAIFIVTEIIGKWGFGHAWNRYRVGCYILRTGVAMSAWFGVLLGSGKVGLFLIMIGKLIS